jgi:hypothetical protein
MSLHFMTAGVLLVSLRGKLNYATQASISLTVEEHFSTDKKKLFLFNCI